MTPRTAQDYHQEGITNYVAYNYKAAIECFTLAIQLDPNYTSAYLRRGEAYYQHKEYLKAIADCDKALSLDPDYIPAYYTRGVAKYKLYESEDGLEQLNKDYSIGRNLAGLAKYKNGEYRAAIDYYDRAIRYDGNFAAAYNNRANAKYQLSWYDDAALDYERAIQLDQHYADAHSNPGIVVIDQIEYRKKIQNAIAALKTNPKDVAAGNLLFITLLAIQDIGLTYINKDELLSAITLLPNEQKSSLLTLWFDLNSDLGRFALTPKNGYGECSIKKGCTEKAWKAWQELHRLERFKQSLPTFFNDTANRKNKYDELNLDDSIDEENNHGYTL